MAEPIRVLAVGGRAGRTEPTGDQPGLRYVGHAGTGTEALRLVVELRPDAVLIDLDEPGADRIGTVEALRTGHPDTPVVIATGGTDAGLIGRAAAAGVSGVLARDAAPGDVLNAVRMARDGGMTVSSNLLTGLLLAARSATAGPYPAPSAGAGPGIARAGRWSGTPVPGGSGGARPAPPSAADARRSGTRRRAGRSWWHRAQALLGRLRTYRPGRAMAVAPPGPLAPDCDR